MKNSGAFILGTSLLLFSAAISTAEIKIVLEHHDGDQVAAGAKFQKVPPPSKTSAAANGRFSVVDGRRDPNGGGLEKLHDGRSASEEDQPEENFFFIAGSDGGRVVIDLGAATGVKQINTYSWHTDTRAPQVYDVYVSDGKGENFNPGPKRGTDPLQCGWKLLAKVDARPASGAVGGQYRVGIADSEGSSLGSYRYVLFDIFKTESDDAFGNTFYSEIAIVPDNATTETETTSAPEGTKTYEMEAGKYQFTMDTTKAPRLTDWANQIMAPVVQEWYPKLVRMLPSEGYDAPTNFSIAFSTNFSGVAATGGRRITGNANWYMQNLKGEAVGSIVHELVHVVQQYGRARRGNPNATRSPGWLVEGIPDYLRWYKFEPQSHGADIRSRNTARARYDGSYRVSANFLNWVVEKYDKEIIVRLNTAMREGKYSEDIWKERTRHTAAELGAEWKEELIAKAAEKSVNSLTDAEKSTGWQLLFDGRDLNGWHNFKADGVRPGWQVKDGVLICVDPHNAGDIVTSNQFDWFELTLDYNISEAGNSGIMFHVTDEGRQAWATGPEFQLEDNEKAADKQRCGWLYGLYKPEIDPKTGNPFDATKPVGQWNHVRLLVSPEKCEHEINGVKYFDYVLHSPDFDSRVAKSKFKRMPRFAKSDLGFIALQGDHGSISFRNIKVRPIESKR